MPDDSDLRGALERWQSAGLVTAEQADAIRAFERGRRVEAGPSPDGITVVEVLAYAGAVVALAGVLVLLGTRYTELGSAGRLGVLGLVTAFALGAAVQLGRGAGGPAVRRARAAAAALAVLGLSALVYQTQVEAAGGRTPPEDHALRILLVTALAGSAAAGAALGWTGSGLLAVLLAVGVYESGSAVIGLQPSWADEQWPQELVYAVCGVVLVAAAEVCRRRRQRWSPEVLGFAGVLLPTVAAYLLARGDLGLAMELLGGLVALLGFAAAVLRSSPGYAIAGAAGVFGFVLDVELRHFQDSLGFALTLITSGLALLAIAYLTARLLPRLARR